MLEARFARRLDPAAGGREGRVRTVTAPLLDLTLEPASQAERATQLIHGEAFEVYEEAGDFARGRAVADGYVGWVPATGLGAPLDASAVRTVTALATQIYPGMSIKLRETATLPFLARVAVAGEEGGFVRLAGGGRLPAQHLAPRAGDFVAQAERFLGTPYLWGGRSPAGIDCSGLVQVALAAVGICAPRDTDMQEAWLGTPVAESAPVERGDLLFWRGHIAIAVDAEMLLHANAFHMAVAREPLTPALARIAGSGGGPVTARKRIVPGDTGWTPPV